jgi:hypothetical protein
MARLIQYHGALYRKADPVPPEIIAILQDLDRWFAAALEQLYRAGTVDTNHDQAARWLRQLDEYLVVNHEERPVSFESRAYDQLEAVYSAGMSNDIVVYLTDGGFSRFILPDEPGRRLTITPHNYGMGSTKQVEARWLALVAVART